VRQAYLKENSDTVRRFMKAWIEGIHYMKTHKDFTLNVFRKHTKSEDPSALEETYRIFAMKYLPPAPYPTEETVKTILELIASSQPKAKTAQPKDFIDPSWVRELEESGFIKTLYG
jgi:ABC-type nitrate/sulfonate/bicarbonate transport system substrate-binding protein